VADAVLAGDSSTTQTIRQSIKALASLGSHVIFVGEPGTGRRTCAELLHCESPQRDRPFVAVSIDAANVGQIEARLFGARGVATLAAQARSATLYLGEIDRLPLPLQMRLCEALTDGSTPGIRVLAATTRPLEAHVGFRTFSRALFDRIGLLQISIPPLRERLADVGPIAHHALRTWNERGLTPPRRFGSDAIRVLEEYSWPDNVRELVEVVHGACAATRARTVTAARLRIVLGRRPKRAAALDVVPLRELECQYIQSVILDCNTNLSLTARRLGIGRATLARRLRDCERLRNRAAS
jgi:DNA-binding NtrC family response regulator